MTAAQTPGGSGASADRAVVGEARWPMAAAVIAAMVLTIAIVGLVIARAVNVFT